MKDEREMTLEEFKFKRCPSDCPDRSIEPNCHETCEGYLFRCEENKKKRQRRRVETDFYNFKKERVRDTKKKVNLTP